MAEEIEVKFLDVEHDVVRKKLKQLGAVQTHKRTLHKRKVYDYADGSLEKKGGWVRLRDEGDKITLTYKQNNHNADGRVIKTLEDEVVVSDYTETDRLLTSIGLKEKSTQENYREIWRLRHEGIAIDFMLDEWPHVRPFVELEVAEPGSKSDLRRCAGLLGLSWSAAIEGGIIPVYVAEYTISEDQFRAYRGPLVFDQPKPDFLKK